MNRQTRKLLLSIVDGKWYFNSPEGVGATTVNTAHTQGFVRTKRVVLKREGDLETYRVVFQITSKGKTAVSK